ncbi:ABC transporter permease [Aliiroseovarius sp. KMU-50]|uniref:ABC transporter permease n=1 Tax=Aliiroseovarius salicola TaxID=3009082 RepID=A0ABT4W4F4_9RHOB|nr:ABC transporter permease [Aliiroseovarius sp. KMU-50]MDA5095394.1 ABC transporter permease [Aliiroseovarius sp. KMU-50]
MTQIQPAPAQSHRSFRAISALMLREMSTTYGKSVAGYLWALAEPVGGIALLTIVFSVALRKPSLGESFALYYASGFLPFTAYMDVSRKVAFAFTFSKALLRYPRVTFADAIIARLLLNALTQATIGALVLACVIPLSQSHVHLNIPLIVLSYLMAFSLAAGVGIFNCYLFWRMPAWERIWGIVTRPLFIASAIFFNFEDVPEDIQVFLWFNPLVHVVGQAREGIYVTYSPSYISLTFVFGLSAALGLFGLLMLWSRSNEMLNS